MFELILWDSHEIYLWIPIPPTPPRSIPTSRSTQLSSYPLPIGPHPRVGLHAHLHPPPHISILGFCLSWICSGLVCAITTAVSLSVQRPCCQAPQLSMCPELCPGQTTMLQYRQEPWAVLVTVTRWRADSLIVTCAGTDMSQTQEEHRILAVLDPQRICPGLGNKRKIR